MINIVLHHLKKIIFIFALLLGLGISNEYYSQSGGRRKEHRNQRRGASRSFGKRSAGNADKFAQGAGRKGFFSRLFAKKQGAWVYHPTNAGKKQNKEAPHLFSRYRTKGRKYHSGILAKQNSDRSRKRVKGNKSFSRNKY